MKRRRHGATLGIRRVLSSQLDPLSHYTTDLSRSITPTHCSFQASLVGGVAHLVERRSLAGELSLSCARPAADG